MGHSPLVSSTVTDTAEPVAVSGRRRTAAAAETHWHAHARGQVLGTLAGKRSPKPRWSGRSHEERAPCLLPKKRTESRSLRRTFSFAAIFALATSAMVACDPLFSSKRLSGKDCKPRTLTHVTACTGEDSSFQECHFYFRAVGSPERSWCESIATSAASMGSPVRACDFASPASWSRVDCAHHGISGTAACYACTASALESNKHYVYAYSADCARGIEQVTCNVDPVEAAKKLGEIRM